MSQKPWKGGGDGSSQGSYRVTQPNSKKACANPLFESWIMEWKADAEAKNSKMKFVYAKALKSLRLYPNPLSSGKECCVLENFGTHMCKILDDRMAKENMTHDEPDKTSQFLNDAEGPAMKGTKRKKAESKSSNKKATTIASVTSSKQNKKTRSSFKAKGYENYEEDLVVLLSDDEEDKEDEEALLTPPQKSFKSRRRAYLPAYRSGAYAILIALHKKEVEPDYRGYVTKTELIQSAQEYCDSSMTKADHAKSNHYTAWASMRGLLSKELVSKGARLHSRGAPQTYKLTPRGSELGEKIWKAETEHYSNCERGQSSSDQITVLGSQHSNSDGLLSIPNASTDGTDTELEGGQLFVSLAPSASSSLPIHSVKLEPGQFEIILYVDNCEINGKSKSHDLINELQKNGVHTYVTKLSVGDFIWVCREVVSSTNRNLLTISNKKELVLPYVVERKRTDDLAHSIRDGRYREQKYRLERTNLKVIYLVESYGKGDWGLQEGALSQAMISTQINNGFKIQETSSIKDSCGYLTLMTRHLQAMYMTKTLLGCNKTNYSQHLKPSNPSERYVLLFSDFNDFSSKKTEWNAQEMFARHLMRMKGLSPAKAFAIVQCYPTIHDLIQGYNKCPSDKDKELLLSSLLFGNTRRRIGPSISRKIYRLYNSPLLN